MGARGGVLPARPFLQTFPSANLVPQRSLSGGIGCGRTILASPIPSFRPRAQRCLLVLCLQDGTRAHHWQAGHAHSLPTRPQAQRLPGWLVVLTMGDDIGVDVSFCLDSLLSRTFPLPIYLTSGQVNFSETNLFPSISQKMTLVSQRPELELFLLTIVLLQPDLSWSLEPSVVQPAREGLGDRGLVLVLPPLAWCLLWSTHHGCLFPGRGRSKSYPSFLPLAPQSPVS